MKPNHLFYDSSVNFKNITKKKIFGAILIGITSAITIYCFTYIVREVFRIISLSFQLLPDLISESDRFYYNLFFAALALIFGNSIAINYLLSRPQNIFSRRNNKRNRILNDQIFLNFNFVYWFFKISTMIGFSQ